MEDLPNKIRDQLGLMPHINLLHDNGMACLVIIVEPSTVPISLRGSYYWRSGSVKQELKGHALTDFLLKKMGMTWDRAGYIDSWGRGIEKITEACQTMGYPSPFFDERNGGVAVELLKVEDGNSEKRGEKLSENRLKILDAMRNDPTVSQASLVEIVGIGSTNIDRIKNNIQPTTLGFFDVVIIELEGKYIIHVIVTRGTEKPYDLKKYGLSPAGAFIRIGSGVQQMTTGMIDRLYASRTRNSLRNIPSPRAKLSFNQLKIYYDEKGFTVNDTFLENLDLYTPNGELNYVAYLLADQNSVSIKVAKYSGIDKVDLIENEEYGYCSIIKATDKVLDKLEVENRTFTKITGAAERLQKRMVDRRALREALINAIVHNDYTNEVPPVIEIYSDRLSITSYGGLVPGLSKEEFFAGRSMPRNRELMRVYRDLDFVEQLGSGMNRIFSAYKEDIFEISNNFLEVCFPYDDEYLITGEVTGEVSKLLNVIDGEMKRSEIQQLLGLKHEDHFRQAYLLPALQGGIIEMTIPDKPKSRLQKYRLTSKGVALKKRLFNVG